MKRQRPAVISFALLVVGFLVPRAFAATDPLPSWSDGANKRAIIEFVQSTTDPTSPEFVHPPERIATFDNDGTLWVEQPLYTQVVFAVDRVRELAPQHPDWKSTEPFKTILSGNDSQLADFSIQDFAQVVAETHSGISTTEFSQVAGNWLKTARHPRFKRPYTQLVYLPMLEVLAYMRENGFKTYIVTGGGQDFVRVFADPVYGIVPEQVVGSAGRTAYQYDSKGTPELLKLPKVFNVDDGKGKPESIHLMIGRRPLAAFGNSTGDREMLEWAQAGQGLRLMMLVHHDDAVREYDYGPDSKVGTFSNALMDEAKSRHWHVISMKNDWKQIFAPAGK